MVCTYLISRQRCVAIVCRRFENEIVSMTAAMLNGDSHVTGSLTSGGTESLLMAMKTYRDRAKHHMPHVTQPEMVRVRKYYQSLDFSM